MSKGRRIGHCDVCRCAVFGGDGTPDNPGRVNHGDKRVPHLHKKPYRVIPERVEIEQDNDRGWMDYARGMGAMW